MADRTITISHSERLFGRTITVTETGPASAGSLISDNVNSRIQHELIVAYKGSARAADVSRSGKLSAIADTDARQWADPVENIDQEGRVA